jgi:hypothetical protein
MVQPAKLRRGNDLRMQWSSLHRLSASRSLLVQSKMRPVIVEVANVFVHEALEMAFVQNDDVIEQIPPAGTNEAFRYTILPRALKTGSLGLNPETLDRRKYLFTEISPTIKDQVLRRGIIGKRLADLLRHPCARRMLRHVEVKYASPVVRDDEEAVQHVEGKRRHSKEIHRGDCLAVIAEECCPSLCGLRISWRSSHPAQHGALRDIKTEHLELAMNPRRSPGFVFGYHAEDEFTQFPVHAFSSCTLAMP